MTVCSLQGKLFDSRSKAATRTEQQYPKSVSAGRPNEKLKSSALMISKRFSVKEGACKMQNPSALLMPQCRD